MITEHHLPQDYDAEQAVLGAMLVNTSARNQAMDVITSPEAFMGETHDTIWSLIVGMHRDQVPIDLRLCADEMRKQQIENVDDSYLVHLAEAFCSVDNVTQYAEIVQEQYRRREMVAHCELCATDACDQGIEARVTASKYSTLFANVASDGVAGTVSTGAEVLAASPRVWSTPNYGFIPSGLASLDALVGGLPLGEQVILAARPSIGKTSFALFCAASVTQADIPALFISVEMRLDRIADRLIGLGGTKPASTMRRYDSPDDWEHGVAVASNELHAENLYLSDSLRTEQDIVAAATTCIRRHGVKLVCIDYLQLVKVTNPAKDNRNREVGAMTEAFKGIAQDTGVCVLTLSQLNRQSAHSGKPPHMSELRDSGEIEQHADMVLLLHREEAVSREAIDDLTLLVAKNRNGTTGVIDHVQFAKAHTQFSGGV